MSPYSIAGCPKAGKTLSLLARREHWTRQKTGDKIIRAAGLARAAFFVCAKSVHAGNLLGGGELLREVLVYVCKPDSLVMQASFEYNEECSC
jgi:hypothetical protein